MKKDVKKLKKVTLKYRKHLEAVGKNIPESEKLVFPYDPYYWQHIAYISLLDSKN